MYCGSQINLSIFTCGVDSDANQIGDDEEEKKVPLRNNIMVGEHEEMINYFNTFNNRARFKCQQTIMIYTG